MIKNIFIAFIIMSSITIISLATEQIELIKCFVEGNNNFYKTELKINGVTIAKENVFGVKIFDVNNPLKAEVENLPSFVKEKIAFVLKKGENDITIKFEENDGRFKPSANFSFVLKSVDYNTPLFYYSSSKKMDSIHSKFYIPNSEEEPKDFTTSLGNKDATFIYSEKILYFQAVLNNQSLKAFGNTNGLTDLNLKEGSNKLEVNYKSLHEGDFTYYIQTPNFSKKVTKTITKDQLDKKLVDTYLIKN